MRFTSCLVFMVAVLAAPLSFSEAVPFLGRWALSPDNGGAGWLEVRQAEGFLDGTLLWMGGSPEPLTRVYLDDGRLVALRVWNEEVRDASGAVTHTLAHPVTLTATLDGEKLLGELSQPSNDGLGVFREAFCGARIPPTGPRPDLSTVHFGEPVSLFNGKNLDGWVVMGGAHWGGLGDGSGKSQGWIPVDENVANGWTAGDGILRNAPEQKEGEPYKRYGNLATRGMFGDFNLTLEARVPTGGNSGIYLRGIYEIQVIDSFGKPLDCHNMGALYGRITPAVAAEKAAGEWQSLDITLVERHLTVKLNGTTIIDNQPVAGCTGGALWSDESRPGPFYLQGDHTAVEYRNIVLRPVLKQTPVQAMR